MSLKETIEFEYKNALKAKDKIKISTYRLILSSIKDLDITNRSGPNKIIGITGLDTRSLTNFIRDKGAPKGTIAYSKKGRFNISKLTNLTIKWSGLKNLDLAEKVTTPQNYIWKGLKTWKKETGYKRNTKNSFHIVAIDYLAKYINSPETIFFKKGSNLYNLDLARKLSNKLDSIYLVEGYMDVVGLSKNGIENVVANLGTSLTDKQILTLNQFFDDIIICFDGDESGYKAALRAAENSIRELKPEKQISFLFLPDKEDPDSYVNKNGKNNFVNFTKQTKLSIHQFIFGHYKRHTENNPSSMAIFEKKLRGIASTIKDDYIKKYVLEFFLEKIAELTPHINQNKKNFFLKKTKSLETTKKHFKESQSLTGVELKEFSLLYLVMNNLKLLQSNIYLIENIKLFTTVNKQIFLLILEKLKSGKKIKIEDLNLDEQLLDKINKFAPIKHILKNKSNNDHEIIELLEDTSRDLINYDLEFRIQELESQFSKDLSEATFNELKELKKKQNIN